MRLSVALCLALLPGTLSAETLTATSRVVSVTLYPWGASVVRRVDFDAVPGRHDLIVPDLPADARAETLRVAGEGVSVGAVTLATGRLPAPEAEDAPEVAAARAEVERLEEALRVADEGIAAIRLKAEAANDRWAFLKSLAGAEGVAALSPDDLRAMSRMIGEETLAARQDALTAQHEAEAAERARKDDLDALEEARARLSALVAEGEGRAVLSLAVDTEGGPASIEVTTFTDAASWTPVYDLRLSQEGTPALTLDRGVLVSQSSGEDWRGVALTLSTARPAEQSAPSEVYAWLRRIMPDVVAEEAEARLRVEGVLSDAYLGAAPIAPAAEPVTAKADYMGATVVYRYPAAVDLRDGVEDLRLALDTLTLDPTVLAVAVPSRDTTAFLVTEFVNDTGEILLPGATTLHLDGAMVGAVGLPLVAAGAEADVGFGPIDGLRLTRRIPDRSEGERGLLSSRNQIDELAILTVENVTGRPWPVRVLDAVPYSEQDDLEVTWTASPPVSDRDVDGRRGVLAWDFTLDPGQTREIRLEHSLKWPEGFVLN